MLDKITEKVWNSTFQTSLIFLTQLTYSKHPTVPCYDNFHIPLMVTDFGLPILKKILKDPWLMEQVLQRTLHVMHKVQLANGASHGHNSFPTHPSRRPLLHNFPIMGSPELSQCWISTFRRSQRRETQCMAPCLEILLRVVRLEACWPGHTMSCTKQVAQPSSLPP